MKAGYLDFDEYIRQGEPGKKEKASIWRTAIGLQAVDGQRTSAYLKDTARKHIAPRHPRQKYLLTVKGMALYYELTKEE